MECHTIPTYPLQLRQEYVNKRKLCNTQTMIMKVILKLFFPCLNEIYRQYVNLKAEEDRNLKMQVIRSLILVNKKDPTPTSRTSWFDFYVYANIHLLFFL